MLLKCIYDVDTGTIRAYVKLDQDLQVVLSNYQNVAVVDVDATVNKLTAGTFKIDLDTMQHVPI